MMTRLPLFALLVLACNASAKPFVSRVAMPAGFAPESIAAADFDGDGRVDVALCGENQQLMILAGDGRGGYRPLPQTARCGMNPSAMIAADLDGDRRVDLAVANHDTDHITVIHNDGGGRFTARPIPVHSVPHPHTVTAADVDGDRRVDLITDSWGENRLTLLLADGHGSWHSPGTPIDVGRKPYVNVVAADLDGDGHIDLAMSNSGFDTVSVFFGDGHGAFKSAAQSPIAAGATPFMIAVADVNGDGRPDIVVANYSGHITDIAGDGLTWLRNDGGRRFTAFPQRVMIGRGAWHIAAGDLDGDGIADTAFINAADHSVSIAYGSRQGPRPGFTVPVGAEPHRVAIAGRELFVITERDELVVVRLRTPAARSSSR
jgi:hypothetical protein